MDRIIEILKSMKPCSDFANSKAIVDSGLLTSLQIVSLVSKLNDEFDIEIGVEELLPENFNTVEAIWSMVRRLEDE